MLATIANDGLPEAENKLPLALDAEVYNTNDDDCIQICGEVPIYIVYLYLVWDSALLHCPIVVEMSLWAIQKFENPPCFE